MNKENIHIFDTPKLTAEAFGDYMMKKAAGKDIFHCALSGGSTPKLLFDYLAEKHRTSPLWDTIHFYWGDERCVPPEHEESNYKMTRDHLFNMVDIPEENIHRIKGERLPHREAERYSEELETNLPIKDEKPVFDLIILGLGNDGHTASVFPHQLELLKSPLICDVATHPDSGQKRVTLTGSVINASREVVFLVTGESKKDKVKEVIAHTGHWRTYPASYVQPVVGELKWFMDKAAATEL